MGTFRDQILGVAASASGADPRSLRLYPEAEGDLSRNVELLRLAEVIETSAVLPHLRPYLNQLGLADLGRLDGATVFGGLPACRPGWPVTFVEWTNHGGDPDSMPGSWGMLFEEVPPQEEDESDAVAKYVVRMWHPGDLYHRPHPMLCTAHVELLYRADGTIIDVSTVSFPVPRGAFVDGFTEEGLRGAEGMLRLFGEALLLACLGLAFVNSRAVELKTVTPSAIMQAGRGKRKPRLLRYHVLILERPAVRAVGNHEEATERESPALHIVRGHRVNWRGQRIVWRRAHWRGDPSKGVVLKDYRLAVKDPALVPEEA